MKINQACSHQAYSYPQATRYVTFSWCWKVASIYQSWLDSLYPTIHPRLFCYRNNVEMSFKDEEKMI